jgi:hypothetical protein
MPPQVEFTKEIIENRFHDSRISWLILRLENAERREKRGQDLMSKIIWTHLVLSCMSPPLQRHIRRRVAFFISRRQVVAWAHLGILKHVHCI